MFICLRISRFQFYLLHRIMDMTVEFSLAPLLTVFRAAFLSISTRLTCPISASAWWWRLCQKGFCHKVVSLVMILLSFWYIHVSITNPSYSTTSSSNRLYFEASWFIYVSVIIVNLSYSLSTLDGGLFRAAEHTPVWNVELINLMIQVYDVGIPRNL